MTARHVDEIGIVTRRPDGEGVADEPDHQAGHPQPQSQTQGRRQCPVHNSNGSGGAGHENGFGEGAVDGGGVVGWQVGAGLKIEGHLQKRPAAERKEGQEEG